MSRCPGKQKIATRAPPILCNANHTSHPSDPTLKNAVFAGRLEVRPKTQRDFGL
jgi:hypothetical protein